MIKQPWSDWYLLFILDFEIAFDTPRMNSLKANYLATEYVENIEIDKRFSFLQTTKGSG